MDFEWIGDPISVNEAARQLTSKTRTFYKTCKYLGTEYNIGDHVLIANSEADDPESFRHCYVASLVYMYEMKSNKKDPFRAQVQWYSRVEQLSKNLRKDGVHPPLDDAWELVHEGQRYKGDVSIETIFDKCSVLICEENEVPRGVGKQKKLCTFFCRFALGPKNSRDLVSVKESLTKQLADMTAKTLVDSFSAINQSDKEPTTPRRISTRSRKMSENDNTDSSVHPELINTPRSSTRNRQPSRQLDNGKNESCIPSASINTPRSSRRNRQPLLLVDSEDDESSVHTGPINTPRSSKRIKQPPRCLDETLPSPLKNSTFSISSNKTKELCIVIQRCKVTPNKEISAVELDQASKVKARKKLDLETPVTPTKAVEQKTPKKPKRAGSVTPGSTQKKRLRLTPAISSRSGNLTEPTSPLGEIRRRLHVAAVPQTLPCREDEFDHIYNYVEGKLADGIGGCMYISGVPGTGKTATVSEVIRVLKESQTEGDLPDFKLIEVNGMKLTAPQQIYVQIWNQLTGSKVTADKAAKLLHAKFSTNGPRHRPTVLIVDELDLLWTRQQDVLYNIFEWPNRPKAQLTVLAIANTMDLPERLLMNRVSSRMGLTRLTFQPYKVKQLQTIISSRLENLVYFEPEAVEFIARKVSAASGDARRALDISRRAAELAEKGSHNISSPTKSPPKRGAHPSKSTVTMQHVQAAIEEMFSSPKLLAIQACSLHEQLFLNALVQEFNRTGVEESVFDQVIRQHYTLCDLEGMSRPNVSELLSVCASLCSSRLILSEHGRNDIRQKLRLNIGIDDVSYALKCL